MPRTPSLDSLRIFVVAARHLSFTDAASELNLTQSAISHRIRGLEEELGFRLFKRLTRRIELTSQGQALAYKLEQAIGDIDRSVAGVAPRDDATPLKVTMLPSVASHWFIPRLARMRRNGNIDVQVIADPRLTDLQSEGIDLAIRFGRVPSADYSITRLMSDRMIPVCAPELVEKHQPITSIDALMQMPLLHDAATEGDGSNTDWRSWLEYFHRRDVSCSSGQYFSEAGMMIDAAMLGVGVGLARASLVADHIADGRLVCPLDLASPAAYSYYLLGLPDVAERRRTAALRKLLVAEARATETSMLSLGAAPAVRAMHA